MQLSLGEVQYTGVSLGVCGWCGSQQVMPKRRITCSCQTFLSSPTGIHIPETFVPENAFSKSAIFYDMLKHLVPLLTAVFNRITLESQEIVAQTIGWSHIYKCQLT